MKPININAYLAEAEERFSGFNGNDFEAFDAQDPQFYPSAEGAQAERSPAPYQLIIQNTTAGTLSCTLFNMFFNTLSTNFGNNVGIVITPGQTNLTYTQVLFQTAFQPFESSLIRVQSTNSSQVTQTLTITTTDSNGQSCSAPVITQSYFSAYQQQSTIVDVPYNLRIDGNTSVAFNVLASTIVTITFFPASKVNIARPLVGGKSGVVYGAPPVPTFGVIAGRPVGSAMPYRG